MKKFVGAKIELLWGHFGGILEKIGGFGGQKYRLGHFGGKMKTFYGPPLAKFFGKLELNVPSLVKIYFRGQNGAYGGISPKMGACPLWGM